MRADSSRHTASTARRAWASATTSVTRPRSSQSSGP
jgi:hypothetical protein